MLLFKTIYSYLYHKKKNPSSIKIYQPKTLLAEKKTLQEIIIYILTFPNLLKFF